MLTITDNDDLVFSVINGELLKVSSKLRVLFGESFWVNINNLYDYDKITFRSNLYSSRIEAYRENTDFDCIYEIKSTQKFITIKEVGWFNSESNSIHLLIFPLAVKSNFVISWVDIVDMIDKFIDPCVLFDVSLSKVLLTNYNLIKKLIFPLSELGKGFEVSDFFAIKEDFQKLANWVVGGELDISFNTLLFLSDSKGAWFEVHFSKISVDDQVCILGRLRDIDNLVKEKINQEKKYYILSQLSEIQNSFLSSKYKFYVYDKFLSAILEISDSSFGFIGAVNIDSKTNDLFKILSVIDSNNSNVSVDSFESSFNSLFFSNNIRDLANYFSINNFYLENNNSGFFNFLNGLNILNLPFVNSMLAIPIIVNGQFKGLICLINKNSNEFINTDFLDLQPFVGTFTILLETFEFIEANQLLKKDSQDKALLLNMVGDYSSDIIIVLDNFDQIKLLSSNYKTVLGLDLDIDIFKNLLLNVIKDAWNSENEFSQNQFRKRFVLNDYLPDNCLEISINYVPEIGHSIAIIRDVTFQFAHEEKLKIALEKEKDFKNFLSNFLSLVSHEFKTPLATLSSSCELIEYYSKDKPKLASISKHSKKMNFEIQNLKNLVSNALDYDRFAINNPLFKKSFISFRSFFNQLLQDNNLVKSIVFKDLTSEDIKVSWDSFMMERALLNLIKNSIKYSFDNDNIILEIYSNELGFGFNIQDDGIGIDSKDIAYVFTPFFRGSNTHSISGSGMGLSIVKNVVEGHGGTISIKSKINQGTTVSVFFEFD